MREGVVDVVILGVVRALARGERTRAFIHSFIRARRDRP